MGSDDNCNVCERVSASAARVGACRIEHVRVVCRACGAWCEDPEPSFLGPRGVELRSVARLERRERFGLRSDQCVLSVWVKGDQRRNQGQPVVQSFHSRIDKGAAYRGRSCCSRARVRGLDVITQMPVCGRARLSKCGLTLKFPR